jgi:glycosyltransferase involved in cell wall biosynthesis
VPDEEAPFAGAIVKVLLDPEAARAMGRRGRRYAVEHRAYGVIADMVEKQLLSVVESGS